MKKNIAILILVSFFPISAFAAIDLLNGLSASSQTLVTPSGANTMHMEIVTVGTDRHRFRWDGTPWRVDQGGTGTNSFASGALILGNNSDPLATATNIIWDNIFNSFRITGSGTDFSIFGSNSTGQGGDVSVYAGDSTGGDNGGALTLIAGTASGNNVFGGNATLNAGGGGVGVATGGQVLISGGNAGVTGGNAGRILLFGGNAYSSGFNAGDIELMPGRNFATNLPGKINLIDNLTSNEAWLDTSNLSQNRKYSFPDSNGTFGMLETDQVWSGNNIFSKGASATTTVSFGLTGDISSRTCFNAKNSEGGDVSFYFVGSNMVVEADVCK